MFIRNMINTATLALKPEAFAFLTGLPEIQEDERLIHRIEQIGVGRATPLEPGKGELAATAGDSAAGSWNPPADRLLVTGTANTMYEFSSFGFRYTYRPTDFLVSSPAHPFSPRVS